MIRLHSHRLSIALLASCLVSVLLVSTRFAHAHTPESPIVKEMVAKAVGFLEKNGSGEPGGQALIAMALLKAGKDASHPQVQKAIQQCRQLAARVAQRGVGNHCYNEAIACIFLCEINAEQFRSDIEALVQGLVVRQRPNGTWGYYPHTHDDTSQTQYGVLAMWAAHAHKIQVPAESVAAAANWLMRTQDVSGGWTYEGQDPGRMQRIQQQPPTHSMSAGGLGSVYICGYLLGYGERAKKAARQDDRPSALREVEDEEEADRFLVSGNVQYDAFQNCTSLGNRWFARNMTYDFPKWTYYFMYGLERCKAFQAFVEGETPGEPKWYNDGVEYLRQTQKDDGSWNSPLPLHATASVDTAFAVMFLELSTKKSIQKTEEGRVTGNKYLPDDLTQIMVDARGKVIDEKETPPIEQLLRLLEDPDSPDLMEDIPVVLTLGDDPEKRAEQIARLRRMAVNGSYKARLIAVKTVGRDRDLRNVPVLIFALSDPDWRIQKAARDGLRFISRKFDGFGMPEKPSRQQWRNAQAKWKDWFLSVRPDGELIE